MNPHTTMRIKRQRRQSRRSRSSFGVGVKLKYLTKSPNQTKKMGEILAKEILKTKQQESAFVLGLEGDLGGGKTTFLQGFARGLGIKEKILSPTFIIMRKFRMGPKRSLGGWRAGWSPIRQPADQFLNLYHIDCYRIKKTKEILELGFKEVISQPPNIIAIEWADRIRKILPKYILILKFKFIKKNKREIIVQYKND